LGLLNKFLLSIYLSFRQIKEKKNLQHHSVYSVLCIVSKIIKDFPFDFFSPLNKKQELLPGKFGTFESIGLLKIAEKFTFFLVYSEKSGFFCNNFHKEIFRLLAKFFFMSEVCEK
jgi:hypothetical protein